MLKLVRTDSTNPDFIALVKLLDADLAFRDGDEHAFYAQLNKTDLIRHVVVIYEDEVPVSCGAIRQYDSSATEVKRMFTQPEQRGKRLAAKVLAELEKWAAELGFKKCILETGKKQPEAIALYTRSGYQRTPNYGKYAGVENSVCFEKVLVH